jgi:hypothetical protein
MIGVSEEYIRELVDDSTITFSEEDDKGFIVIMCTLVTPSNFPIAVAYPFSKYDYNNLTPQEREDIVLTKTIDILRTMETYRLFCMVADIDMLQGFKKETVSTKPTEPQSHLRIIQ